MNGKDIADLFIEAVGKIEFYWNFYTVTLLALIGWLAGGQRSLGRRLRWFVTVGFAAFATMNMLGLWGSYEFAEALRNDLLRSPETIGLPNARKLLATRNFLDQRAFGMAIHVVIDGFAVLVIWQVRSENRNAAKNRVV